MFRSGCIRLQCCMRPLLAKMLPKQLVCGVRKTTTNIFSSLSHGVLQTEMYALHDEVVHLLRQSALLGLWFLVMREPLQLARDAKLWNKAAAEAVCSPEQFSEHHVPPPIECEHHLCCVVASVLLHWRPHRTFPRLEGRKKGSWGQTRSCMQGKKQVWNDRLLDLHIHMWRVLTVLVILWGMLLVREAIVQALSRQFHQTRRFDQLTVRVSPGRSE